MCQLATGAETKAAPADDGAAQKSVKSSTWVNPNVATTVVPRPVAATAAVAPVKNEDDATVGSPGYIHMDYCLFELLQMHCLSASHL